MIMSEVELVTGLIQPNFKLGIILTKRNKTKQQQNKQKNTESQ